MDSLQIKGIIFDKDGTLFHYGEVWGSIISKSLEVNLPWPTNITAEVKSECLKAFEAVIGVDSAGHSYADGIIFNHNKVLSAIWRIIKLSHKYRLKTSKTIATLMSLKNGADEALRENLNKMILPDVKKVFKKCKDNGYILGLVTNDSTYSTSVFLSKMEIEDYLSFVRTGETAAKRKPNPQTIKEFCKEFSLKSQEVCVIGDTLIDMEYAERGKCGRKIAVLTGSGDREALEKKVDAIYPELSDITNDPVLFPNS